MTGVFALNNCDYSRHQFGQHFSDSIGAFQQPRTKGMQFRTRNIIPEVWNEILPTESHILWLQTPSLLPHLRSHTHTHTGSTRRFLWVILATDLWPVIVSSAAGSEASLSYWPELGPTLSWSTGVVASPLRTRQFCSLEKGRCSKTESKSTRNIDPDEPAL